MKKKLALVTILTFLFVMMGGFVPALAEDGLGEWVQLADCPIKVVLSSVALNGKIYVLGYNLTTDTKLRLATYDTKINMWTDDIKDVGVNGGIGAIDGRIYIVEDRGENAKILFYDLQTDLWTEHTTSLSGSHTTSTVIDSKIYIFGGNGDTHARDFNVYDPVTKELTLLPTIDYASNAASSVNYDNKMYLGSGYSLSAYDPITNSWTRLSDSQYNLTYSGACLNNDKIYMLGGRNENFFQIYDPATDQWSQLPQSPGFVTDNSNKLASLVAYEGKIYHVAFDNSKGFYVYTPEDYTGPTDPTDPTEPATPTNLQILMAKNETVNLTTFLIGTPDPEAMQWASSDTAIATVNENGNVTAVEVGTSVISVQNEDGSFKAAVRVRVMEGGLAPSGDPRLMVMLSTGEKFRLELTGGDDPVTWTSNDEAIVTVATWNSENRIGEVTAVAPGLTYITATDGTQTEQIYVQVR